VNISDHWQETSMAKETSTGADLFSFYQDMFLSAQKFLPTNLIAERITQAAQGILEAQIAYAQAVMGVNARLLGNWSDRPDAAGEERPSVAAKKPEFIDG